MVILAAYALLLMLLPLSNPAQLQLQLLDRFGEQTSFIYNDGFVQFDCQDDSLTTSDSNSVSCDTGPESSKTRWPIDVRTHKVIVPVKELVLSRYCECVRGATEKFMLEYKICGEKDRMTNPCDGTKLCMVDDAKRQLECGSITNCRPPGLKVQVTCRLSDATSVPAVDVCEVHLNKSLMPPIYESSSYCGVGLYATIDGVKVTLNQYVDVNLTAAVNLSIMLDWPKDPYFEKRNVTATLYDGRQSMKNDSLTNIGQRFEYKPGLSEFMKSGPVKVTVQDLLYRTYFFLRLYNSTKHIMLNVQSLPDDQYRCSVVEAHDYFDTYLKCPGEKTYKKGGSCASNWTIATSSKCECEVELRDVVDQPFRRLVIATGSEACPLPASSPTGTVILNATTSSDGGTSAFGGYTSTSGVGVPSRKPNTGGESLANLEAIAGGVLGGMVLLATVSLLFFFLHCRRRQKKAKETLKVKENGLDERVNHVLAAEKNPDNALTEGDLIAHDRVLQQVNKKLCGFDRRIDDQTLAKYFPKDHAVLMGVRAIDHGPNAVKVLGMILPGDKDMPRCRWRQALIAKTRPCYTSGPLAGTPFPLHANILTGAEKEKAFILSQAPKPEEFEEFFKMIVDHKVSVLVQLLSVEDLLNPAKYHEYLCNVDGQTTTYGDIELTLLKTLTKRDDMHITRVYSVGARENKKKWTLNVLQYRKWGDFGVTSGKHMLAIRNIVNGLLGERKHTAPVLVHCSAGLGRSGCFAIGMLSIQLYVATGMLNIADVFRCKSYERANMVQTMAQFCAIYQMVHAYFEEQQEQADRTMKQENRGNAMLDKKRLHSTVSSTMDEKTKEYLSHWNAPSSYYV